MSSYRKEFNEWGVKNNINVFDKLSDVTDKYNFELEKGQKCTFTNEYGMKFENLTIMGFCEKQNNSFTGEDSERYVYLDKDSYWLPVNPHSIRLEKTAENNLSANSIIGKEASEIISMKEQTQLLGNKLSEEYRKLGYESVAEVIDCSIKDFVTNDGIITTTDNQHQILKSGSKVLYGDITIDNKNGIPEVNLSNLSIKDNSTGKTSPLATNKMDIKELSANDMKKVLSGGKAQANGSSFQLSKTAIGWSITAAKQIFSTVDASAGI